MATGQTTRSWHQIALEIAVFLLLTVESVWVVDCIRVVQSYEGMFGPEYPDTTNEILYSLRPKAMVAGFLLFVLHAFGIAVFPKGAGRKIFGAILLINALLVMAGFLLIMYWDLLFA
jgi:hypothetical protein